MKRNISILLVLAMVAISTGCASTQGSNWWKGRQVNTLAIKKLETSTSYGHEVRGYAGIIKNFSKRHTYNFKISGPEETSFLVAPGGLVETELIPGSYTAQLYRGGNRIGPPWHFTVNAQIKNYLGRPVHWYLYAEY